MSASKPEKVAAALHAEDWPLRWLEPVPASIEALCRVHDPSFVDAILSLRRNNGFGGRSASVAASLKYTCGGFHTAAVAALETGLSASLTSGFHHAHYDAPRGFCTFNGLMVSAGQLFADGAVERIAIIDCDYHYGDGTDALIDRMELRDRIFHLSFGKDFESPRCAEDYLQRLRDLAAELKRFRPGIIFYQAGADTHVEDLLGGMLTTDQMRRRDRIMFEIARCLEVPLTWNLAGGYEEDDQAMPRVVQLHLNTFEEALDVYGLAAPR